MIDYTFFLQGLYLLVSIVFLYYGLPKVFIHRKEFADVVSQYQILPGRLVKPFARVLPVVELVAATMVLIPVLSIAAVPLLTLLTLMFQVALGKAIVTGLYIDCGCEGSSRKFEHAKRHSLVVAFGRNIALLAILGAVWAFNTPLTTVLPLVLVGATLALGFGTVKLQTYLIYRKARNIQIEEVVHFQSVAETNSRRGFLRTVGAAGILLGLSGISNFTAAVPTALAWSTCVGSSCSVIGGPSSAPRGGCAACGSPIPCYTCYARTCQFHFVYCEWGVTAPCNAVELCGSWVHCWSAACPPPQVAQTRYVY